MTWPTVAVTTTNTDAGTDSPATARTDILDLMTKSNQMIAHVSTFAATVLDDTSAAAARTTLGAAASGANSDITSLTALTAGGLPDNSVLTADIAALAVTPAKLSQPFTAVAAVATTSGVSIDFGSIPSWVKRITLILNAVSTNGSSNLMVQIGDSGGVETTGYSSACLQLTGGANVGVAPTSGFAISASYSPTSTLSGQVVLCLLDQSSQIWTESAVLQNIAATALNTGSGQKAISPGPLTTVRLTTVNGTDAFDAGSASILYE